VKVIGREHHEPTASLPAESVRFAGNAPKSKAVVRLSRRAIAIQAVPEPEGSKNVLWQLRKYRPYHPRHPPTGRVVSRLQ